MQHILSLSYGKDSLACLGAIEQLGWPLDRIVHAEVWATDTIPADLPPMVEFKTKADAIIKAPICFVKDFIKPPNKNIFSIKNSRLLYPQARKKATVFHQFSAFRAVIGYRSTLYLAFRKIIRLLLIFRYFFVK